MGKINDTPDFVKMGAQLKKNAVRFAGVTGVEFFKDSFQNQGFTDVGYEAWELRKDDPDPGRKVLVQSAYLMNSIEVFDANDKRIVFGSDAEYAEIHNNGGIVKIPITKKSRKYFWFMFSATNNTMWKALALTKKQSITMKMPQRKFLGESATLMGNFDTWLKKEIITKFKHL